MPNVAKKIVIRGTPSWLPPALRDRPKDLKVSFRFTGPEKDIYRKRKKIPISEWAEKHRTVTRGPLEGTRFRKTTTPYLAGIMDAAWFPSVQTVILCATPQVGKSFLVDTCAGYAIDRDPGAVLYVYPDEDTSDENMKDRILPMIRQSPRLRSYLTGLQNDESGKRVNLRHMQIYMAWARSAAKLGNKSIKYLICDEVDKYPDTANKREAGPIDLAESRTLTYRWAGRKIFKISTPTIETGPIWQALTEEAEVIFDYWTRCPFCRKFQVMRFVQIKFPKDERDPERIQAKNLAWYECEHCGKEWDEYRRDLAVRRGQWRSREEGQALKAYLFQHRPLKIGFHIPSWLSHFVAFGEIAAAFLRGLKDKTKFKDFRNKHEALPWKDYTVERKEDRILALRNERYMGLVPSGGIVSCLTAGIDTQDKGFYYEIRAWGWGMNLESWQVRFGYVETFEALKEVLLTDRYKDVDGREYFVRLAIQDAMGHRTSDVYDFTRVNKGVIPFKGEQRLTQPHTWSKIDVYPGTTKPIPGGIRLLRADSNFFKNQLARKLEINPGDPGAWHLCSEATEEYARQMCAEYQDEKGLWQCPEGRANHYWDCSYLNLVAVDVMGVRFWEKPEEYTQGTEEDTGRKASTRPVVRSKFMTR